MTEIAAGSAAIECMTGGGAIDATLLQRFNDALTEIWVGGRLGLAVSGGADSMAMLCLAHEYSGDVAVATVDHGLRSDARAECEFVADACHERSIPCTILKVRVGAGNQQEQARIARYRALGEWGKNAGVSAIATAHHADDQAETLMMRLNRGSGLAGLSGIRPRAWIEACPREIMRPLLSFRRAELREVLRQAGQDFVRDPSNADEAYERVRLRKSMAGADWLDPVKIAQSAAHLHDAERTLQSVADTLFEKQASRTAGTVSVPMTAWADTDGRLVERAIRELGGAPEPGEVRSFVERFARDGATKRNLAGVMIERSDDCFVCKREPSRRTN